MPRVPDNAPRRAWLLDRPGGAAVAAASQQELLGFLFVDMMEWSSVFVEPAAEADQDLVAPRPHAVVGRPARESARFPVDDDVPRTLGRLSGRRRAPRTPAQTQSDKNGPRVDSHDFTTTLLRIVGTTAYRKLL